jgi:hypothetical protein
LIKANSSIVAVQWATTGFGALAVMPTRDGDKSGKTGRLVNPPMIEAHKSSLQDFDISPFNEHLVVTSDGGAIKLWQVPEGGLTETMREASGEVTGEAVKRLSQLNFHPTSENLLTTCGKDFCLRLFDITNSKQVVAFKDNAHSDLILSTSWSIDGALVATGCKDKMLRISDPRAGKVIHTTEAHPGVKGFTATWLGRRDQIVTAGFSKNGERLLSIWDFRSFSSALHSAPIDTSPGMITPYYDAATEMVFLLGRGDNTIRYYEVSDDEPFIHYLDLYRGADSQADITPFAKRVVDYGSCEIARFAKLTKDKVEHIMFQVPRKDAKDAQIFHEDLYKYVPSSKPSTTAQEWIKGATKEIVYFSAKEMMPTGYRSIYDIDSTKKAEDEKREQEKRAYQEMTIEERVAMKEATKRANDAARGVGGGSFGSSEQDDDVLAVFAHSRASSLTSTSKPSMASSSSGGNVSSSSSNSNKASTSNSAASASNSAASGSTSIPISAIASATASSAPSSVSSPRQGKQRVNLDDGSTYDGTYKNDQKHGAGVFTHKADGSIYDGSWADDKRSGKGTLKVGSGSSLVMAQGNWMDNVLNAEHAFFTLADESTFEFATFDKAGKITAGKLKYKDGETYEGAFNTSGKRHGTGVWCGKDGGQYEGEYKDDLRHGNGEYRYPDGGVFKGNWKADVPDGEGVFHDKSGKVITGTWSKGKLTKYTVS